MKCSIFTAKKWSKRVINPRLKSRFGQLRNKPVVFLTGAGISAESGIPTFRGKEGYWTVGSTNYHPMDMGTKAAFAKMPDEVWCWYLFRKSICNQAEPNPGHELLAKIEEHLGDRFLLVTQNVDGLHLRAGNSAKRTYEVHGNIDYMRCWKDCTKELFPIPTAIGGVERGQELSDAQRDLLVCPKCGDRSRPHVLWFDECYDEETYRFQSSLKAALNCGLHVSIGSSGSTNLPTQMVRGAAARGSLVIDINPERGPYAQLAEGCQGFWLKGGAGEGLKMIAEGLGICD